MYRKQTRTDLELLSNQQSQEHDRLNGGEQAGVAGPESLLHHHHPGRGRPGSLKSSSFRGGTSKGESTETVFEVGDDELEEDRDHQHYGEEDGDGEGSEWDVRSNRTKKSGR